MGQEIFVTDTMHNELLMLEKWTRTFPWLIAGITSRMNGVSQPPYTSFNCGLHVGDQLQDVLSNRLHLLQHFELPREAWVSANQTHGDQSYYVTERDKGRGIESLDSAIDQVDALYTDQPNLFLASFYADCVPLFFINPKLKLIGIAHAGWKGTAQQIGVKLINEWQARFQSSLSDVLVAIGPAIGGCCYEVDDQVIQQIQKAGSPLSDKAIIPKSNGKYMLDLKQCNYEILIQAGIDESHIEVTRWCTSCHADLFFSHRRDQGRTGRMAAFICRQEEDKGT